MIGFNAERECGTGRAAKTLHLPTETRFREDTGAVGQDRGGAIEAAALRDPEARCDAAALRSAARVRRRVQVLGGDQGTLARSARQAAGGRGRGPSARLWRFRRHDSGRASMAAARSCSGTAAPGSPRIPNAAFKKGDLKFTLHGEKLHGSWVLVRMRHDRTGGKRTNWLLIKHRDEYASEGEKRHSRARTSRSPPAARWIRSPMARDARQNRSCWRRAPRPRPMRSGSPTAARSRKGAPSSRRPARR